MKYFNAGIDSVAVWVLQLEIWYTIIKVFFFPPTDAQVNCLKNNFKIYFKIYIKTAPTYSDSAVKRPTQ
jgi:hypothetical protein